MAFQARRRRGNFFWPMYHLGCGVLLNVYGIIVCLSDVQINTIKRVDAFGFTCVIFKLATFLISGSTINVVEAFPMSLAWSISWLDAIVDRKSVRDDMYIAMVAMDEDVFVRTKNVSGCKLWERG